MRVDSLQVENFRVIELLDIRDLNDMVVIAGPNGCGKSSILDAIRLLKSAYGGYRANEWHQWFNEQQIRIEREPDQMTRLLRDPRRPLSIVATIVISESELRYLTDNLDTILFRMFWREENQGENPRALSGSVDSRGDGVQGRVQKVLPEMMAELEQKGGTYTLNLEMSTSGHITVSAQPVVQTIFETYDPKNLGIIDFYSAHRRYQREQVGGINLRWDTDRYSNSLLYNLDEKHNNIKSELASSYLADLVARESGGSAAEHSLQEALSDLFHLFFTGKRFEGVKPTSTGILSFPVLLDDGSQHDLDDLSSGEKEILYGYLRLRNSGARNSVILIDEPELHLNPRLVSSLPEFYHQYIGREYSNQIWLITHSDALLRQSVGRDGFSVFHMQSKSSGPTTNQAKALIAATELDKVIVELAGDLAAYKPGAPLVVLESTEDVEFDATVVRRLFPEVAERCNLVSGGDKQRVKDLYRLLSASAAVDAVLASTVIAIVDRDSDVPEGSEGVAHWPAYHIENFLLSERSILEALKSLLGKSPFDGVEDVTNALRAAAQETVPEMVEHRMRVEINRTLGSAIDLRFDPKSTSPAEAFAEAIVRSVRRLTASAEGLAVEQLGERYAQLEADFGASLEDGTWRTAIPGRRILQRLVGALDHAPRYEHLRNSILDRMVRNDERPEGMEMTLMEILPAGVCRNSRIAG